MLLRPEIAAPTHIARLSALGLAFAAAGLFAIVRPALETPAAHEAPLVAMATVPDVLEVRAPQVSQTEAPPVSSAGARSVALVFTAQEATWMKLEDLAAPGTTGDLVRAPFPRHGKVVHTTEDYMEIATAPIELADVPAVYRDRLGDKIIVDGTCATYITGFAIVARLTGSTSYAGEDADTSWTGTSVMRYGAPMLAAKLGDCTGTLARDASLPPAAIAQVMKDDDAELVTRAKRLLLASKAAHAATKEWTEHFAGQDQPGPWTTNESTTWKTQMFVHPTTHETWISIHANQLDGCGSPHINVWGLYRVEKDGTLTTFDTNLGEIETIEQLVDVDGDGIVEIVGREWLGGRLVNDIHGTTLERLDEPFYGCPC